MIILVCLLTGGLFGLALTFAGIPMHSWHYWTVTGAYWVGVVTVALTMRGAR